MVPLVSSLVQSLVYSIIPQRDEQYRKPKCFEEHDRLFHRKDFLLVL